MTFKNKKFLLMIMWLLFGLFYIISAVGAGSGTPAIGAMICGFMVARNMSDVVEALK